MIIQLPNVFDGILNGLENFCIVFNEAMEVFFPILKYGLVIVLLGVGYMTIRMYRGVNKGSKKTESQKNEEEQSLGTKLKEPHMILGIFYFALAFGILLGWLTHAFIIVFEPISEIFVLKFVNLMGWIPEESVLRMQDPTLAIFPYEITIYYVISIFSFLGFASLLMGMRFMILYANKSHTTSLKMFIMGLADCFLVGFTTFMPLLL